MRFWIQEVKYLLIKPCTGTYRYLKWELGWKSKSKDIVSKDIVSKDIVSKDIIVVFLIS